MAVASVFWVVLTLLVKSAEMKAGGSPSNILKSVGSIGPLGKAEAILSIADKAVDLVSKVDGIVSKKLDAHYQAVAQRPEDIVKGSAIESIKQNVGRGGKRITFEKLRGFKGIEEFEPSGWQYEEKSVGETREPDGEMQNANAYPMGAGYMMMSGCFGSNYKEGDPCYKVLRFVTRCANQIDSANFIGVGFDITKSYSSESRKKSVVQRTCKSKATFMGQDVPDNMNAYGIYDYSIRTRSFQSALQYREYLASKAGTEMSSGVFSQVSADFQQTRSKGAATIFSDAGRARGSGWSDSAKSGISLTSSLQTQMAQQGAGSSTSFLAVLEADLKLYEIALDHSNSEDLSAPFLDDFMRLPTSYYLIGADIKLQDFILRYGTHFVKTAKFGGKLNIFKSSKRDSKMTEDEFAVASQTEFSAMMGTLHSSFSQTQDKNYFFGLGDKVGTKGRSGSATETKTSKNSKASQQQGSKKNSRSEYIETTVDAMGGDPEIAAAIMDFYSPAFKGLFTKWLASIREYPKPYDMTFGKLPEVLDINAASLFKGGHTESGCFAEELQEDANGPYFIQNKTMSDGNNRTIITMEKKYCKYGKDKSKFMDDFKARRLALERAITIYIAEGPFSVSSFELQAGRKGCETETIRYLRGGARQSHTWPKWNDMKKAPFKVLFQLPFDLPMLKRDVEFEVMYNDGLWFTTMPGETFTIDNSCPSAPGLPSKNRVCVVGMNLIYNGRHGYFTFDKEFYKHETTYAANITRYVGSRFVARAESDNILKGLAKNTIGEVPCNVKWSNAHRIDPQETTSCIHFSAASEGDIFVIFSSIPKDYSSWFYLQMSPSGIAFYRAMKLEKIDNVRSSGTLGEEALFETFFVCVTQEKDQNLKILYGKAPAQREVGLVHAAFSYPDSNKETVSFYTFGAGEEKITIDDVRVIQDKPKMSCGEGYVEVNGTCDLDCHRECDGCHQARDAKSCIACKHVKDFYTEGKFVCLSECPPGYEPNGDVCKMCKAGHYKDTAGNGKCIPCQAGHYQDGEGKLKCMQCQTGHYQNNTGKSNCEKCEKGYHQGSQGQIKCLQCEKGFYQDKEGQQTCSKCDVGHKCPRKGLTDQLACSPNTYNDDIRRTACKRCPKGEKSDAGSASCKNNCGKGTYFKVNGGCRPCPTDTVAPAKGMARCKKCPTGETSNKQRTKCEDKNECATGNGGCSQNCHNTHRSHRCSCDAGYLLNTDKRTCRDKNECLKFKGGCYHICRNTDGSFKCSCNTGYELAADKRHCNDVNECSRNNGGCNHTCNNTVGSYRCSCYTGYKSHGKTCQAIDPTCEFRVTPKHPDGGGNPIWLDKHHLSCPNNGFLSMFHLQRPDTTTIQFKYTCCSHPVTSLCNIQEKTTAVKPDGGGDANFLDRHSVDCGASNIITGFQLKRSGKKYLYYRYSCCILAKKNPCYTRTTSYTDSGDGDTRYFDRQTTSCRSDYLLSYFRQVRSGDKIAYRYRCCKVVS